MLMRKSSANKINRLMTNSAFRKSHHTQPVGVSKLGKGTFNTKLKARNVWKQQQNVCKVGRDEDQSCSGHHDDLKPYLPTFHFDETGVFFF